MRGASTGHSHSRPCFGRKTLRRCRNSEEADDDVILIDVDSDHFDNVIIIDVPDALPKKRKGSSKLMKDQDGPFQTVIYIDDDDDDETPDKFNSFSGVSFSRSFKPPEKDFEDLDAEENPFIQESATPVRLSKCKRTYSGKASTGIGFGLNLDSENNSFANDHPDCELMEDISGKVEEQWKKPDKFNSFAGASSSRSFNPPEKDFEDVDAEENPIIQESATPFRLSKCKRTYLGKASTGIGFGLNLDSENNSFANNHPECDLMEDISGKVEEQWKKAFYRRKKGIKNYQSGIRIQDDDSSIMNDSIHQTVGKKGENDNHMEVPYLFDKGKFSNEDEGTSPLSEEEDAYYNSNYVSAGGSSYRGQHSPSIHTEPEDYQYFERGSSSCHNGKIFKKSSSYSSHNEQPTKEVKKTKSRVDGNSDYGKASSVKDVVAISKGQNSVEVEADPVNIFPTHEFRESHVTATGRVNEMENLEPCDLHESGSLEKTYNLTSVRSSFMSSTVPDKQRNCSFTCSSYVVESVSGESSWLKNSLLGSRDGIKKGCHREIRLTVDVIPLSVNIHVHINDAKLGLDESVSNSGEEDKDDYFHPENGHAVDSAESCMLCEREKLKETDEYKRALEEEWLSRQQALKIEAEEAQHLHQLQKRSKAENGHTMDSVESCMIGEREKFKETDEYKRAMEEEWASRQQALKIQAEEAQHLRRLQKRRKAESMRLMDMERRQKERIEEMRSTQKKDEENMNLKEVIRSEVRKQLNKLEMACQNMSSLLHSFGLQIEGWPNPSPQEVQTAYKRALLTFHPDRALRSDIRQQVEAEEKFKIINRFKEKYASVL